MNVKLLRAIQRQIKKEPRQFFMKWYLQKGKRIPNCGTAACIAGWAVALDEKKTPAELLRQCEGTDMTDTVGMRAEMALDITWCEGDNLFVEAHWPEKFRGPQKTLAKRAIARINHFIKTGE